MKPKPQSCPQCGSARLRRSHSRGVVEHILKRFGRRVFICKDCGWRGKLRAKKHRQRKVFFSKEQVIGLLIAISLVVLIAVYLVNRFSEDSDSPPQSSTSTS